MNAIDELITRFEAVQVAEADAAESAVAAATAEAVQSAVALLPEIFGEAWSELQGRFEVIQAKTNQVAFAFRVGDLELDDFLVVCLLSGSGQWGYRFTDMDWTNRGINTLEELFSRHRKTYSVRRKNRLAAEMEQAETADKVHEAAALLLLHEPGDAARWIERRDLLLRVIETREVEAAKKKQIADDYAAKYREYLVREAEVKAHNREVAQRLQDQVNTPRVLHELEYGVRAEDREIRVDSLWVTGHIPADGWWVLPDGSKRKFFYPVSLSAGREVRPTDRFIDTYKTCYCGGGAAIYHWADENIAQIVEEAGFWKAPQIVIMPDELYWGGSDKVCREVEKQLAAEGIIKLDGDYPSF